MPHLWIRPMNFGPHLTATVDNFRTFWHIPNHLGDTPNMSNTMKEVALDDATELFETFTSGSDSN
jgi:hypothetical protein